MRPNALGLTRSADGAVALGFSGAAQVVYEIEASNNLASWVKMGAATADAAGLFQIVDADAGGHARRFYRAVQR
ncbi:MAG: hypothetical protein HY674_01010 [Chloroflexi bacterium]|nr:hypothetical protein [Chloroflexota bacterium]